MSANSAVTVLRSPSAAPAGVPSWSTRTDGVDATGDFATVLLTGAPHWSQNFDAGWIVAPQFEHEPRKGAAHALQNLAPSRFSVPHFGQIIPTDLHWHRVGARSNLRRRCVGALNRDVPAATTFHRSSPQRPACRGLRSKCVARVNVASRNRRASDPRVVLPAVKPRVEVALPHLTKRIHGCQRVHMGPAISRCFDPRS